MNEEELANLWDRTKLENPGLSDAEVTRRVQQQASGIQPPSRGAGLARAAAQGLTFGFGEEIEAAYKSLLPGREYAQEVANIRGEMEAYRQERPKEALAAETAAGFLVPGAAALRLGRAAIRGTGLARAATGAIGTGITQGALTGAGTTEGGVADRAFGALGGGAVGGVTGGVVGGLTGQATKALMRGGVRQPSDVTAVASALRRAGMTPQELATRAGAAQPGATVADVIGEPAIRTLRGIKTVGGRAGAQVEQAMEERLATSPQRLRQSLYGGRAQENIVEEIDASILRGEAASKPLYRAFERQPEKAIEGVDEILRTPIGQEAVARARRIAANAQRKFIEPGVPEMESRFVDQFGQAYTRPAQPAKYNPQALDDIKKAMDALVYEGRLGRVQPGQGGITPGELNAAKALRRQFVAAVDEAYPDTYAAARSAWSGEFALREALEEGAGLASKTGMTPEAIAKMAGEYDGSELEALRRGFIDGMRQRIEAGKLGYREVGTEAFEKRMKAVLGDEEGTRVVNAFRSEGELVGAARTIRGGSQTAEKMEDAARLGGAAVETFIGPGGIRRAGFASARELAGRFTAPLAERRSSEAAKALLARPSRISDILDAISAEEQRQRVGRAAGITFGGAAARDVTGRLARAKNEQAGY